MPERLAFVHTVASLVAVFNQLCGELLPGTDVFHLVDESLLKNTIRDGSVSPLTARRLVGLMVSAEEAGASRITVTCSSVGEVVALAQPLLNAPAYRVDQPMADQAVAMGRRIGVAATLPTTLAPTARLIQARADAAKREVTIVPKLCEGAFAAVMAGRAAEHDAIVSAGLRELLDRVDVVVLAQASMARVVDSLPAAERRVPVLSSPRLAVEFLAQTLRPA